MSLVTLIQLTSPTGAAGFLNFNGDKERFGPFLAAVKGHHGKNVVMAQRKVQRDSILNDS